MRCERTPFGEQSWWDQAAQAADAAWSAVSAAASSAWDTGAQALASADQAATELTSAAVDFYAQVKASWDEGWRDLEREARTYYDAIQAAPAEWLPAVEAFVAELTGAREDLDALKGRLPTQPTTPQDQAAWDTWRALDQRWHELAAGFWSDAVDTREAQVGVVPLVAVGAIGVGVAAIAWAWVASDYVVNLREQTTLAGRELDERVAASKEGRVLQDSTLPEPPPGPGDALKGLLPVLAVGAALAVALPLLMKR